MDILCPQRYRLRLWTVTPHCGERCGRAGCVYSREFLLQKKRENLVGNTFTVCVWSRIEGTNVWAPAPEDAVQYDWVEVWAGEDMQEAHRVMADTKGHNSCVSLIWRSAGEED